MFNRIPRGLPRLWLLAVLILAGGSVGLPPARSAEIWIPAGSVWRYSAEGTDLGTAWRGDDYDDSTWSVGAAQLGYGDGDETTVINGGPVNNRFITTYFRHVFNVTSPSSITNLTLRVLRDDGAVVYLNGLEVFRSNMPGGTITASTLASSSVSDEDAFVAARISPTLLVSGPNALAVEIHQNSPTSSDVSFDLILEADRVPGPPIILTQPADQSVLSGGIATFSVTASGLTPLQYQWQLDGNELEGQTNSTLTITNVTTASVGSYRVLVRNTLGSVLSEKAVLEIGELAPDTFQIAELSATGAAAIEHGGITGDDRGGIATSVGRVFVTGDGGTGGFDLENLANALIVAGGSRLDALVGDLRAERVYSLGNGATPITGPATVTTLIELDDATALPTGVIVPLSTPITMSPDAGIFSSYGAVVLHSGSRVFRIQLPSGQVTDLGAMPRPTHTGTENWAYWGVAEFVGGTVHLVYVQNSTTIARTRVPDGFTTPLAQFNALSDMASITVSVPLGRWYFHHEGSSQFRSGDETVGYADARFVVAPRQEPPSIRRQPASVILAEGSSASFEVGVRETGPVTYQWLFNGEAIPDATNNPLQLFQVTSDVEGSYSVVVSNAFGATTSQPATLRVVRRALVSVFDDPLFVDTANQPWSESDNVQQSLRDRGYAVTTFTSIIEATAANNVLLFPRFEFGDVASAMNEATRNSLRVFVQRGGLLIIHGTPDDPSRTSRFLNDTFGFSIQAFPDFSGGTYPKASGAAGTAFAQGPASVPFNANMVHVATNALPAGSRIIYQAATGGGAVVRMPYGDGKIVFLGWDWNNALPAGSQDGGWTDVLTLAVQESAVLPPSAPEFLIHPQNTAVLLGGTTTLRGLAFGTVPLSYQWQRNGEDLPGATNETLVLSNVTTNDSALYRVMAMNALGSTTSSNAFVRVVELSGDSFRILSLNASGVTVREHGSVTGDDRGGMAMSANRIFYTGDGGTGIFDAQTLAGVSAPFYFDGLVGDLRTETVYTWGVGNRPIGYGEPHATTLLVIDDATGTLTGERIDLSSPVALVSPNDQTGMFAGYGRIVVHTGDRIQHVSLPSGEVLDLGAAEVLPHAYSESWAFWGVAEFYGGTIHLAYVGSNNDVVRTHLSNGTTDVLGNFDNLSDMASITVSIRRNRWYFHHEGSSQFGSGDEVLGYANASFSVVQQSRAPEIFGQPADLTILDGTLASLSVRADGSLPLSYRWRFNQQVLPGATNRVLQFLASMATAGSYDVIVSNTLGVVTSRVASVTVLPSRGIVGVFVDQGLPSIEAEAAVIRAGFTPRPIVNVATANLSDLSMLIIQSINPISDALQGRLPAIRQWVENGGKLIVHQPTSRTLGPDPLLLGAPQTLTASESGTGLEVPAPTLVTAGPHGTIPQSVWENLSFAGELIGQTLPPNASRILIQSGDSNSVVAVAYGLGAGGVYFSTIPLESYFQSPGIFDDALPTVYLPNVLEYMITLVTTGPILVIAPPENRNALTGGSTSLEVSASGTSPLSYQWQFNGEDLPGATGYRLELTNLTTAAAGDYRVRITNPLGQVTTAPARLSLVTPASFRIVNLLASGSRVVDHNAITGDDRGGIATSGTHVFYSGDDRTGRFLLGDLSGGTALPQVYDAMVSDLRSERLYSLGNGTNRILSGGVVTSLIELNGTTGVPTTNVVHLSHPIEMFAFDVGIFAGYGAVVLHNGTRVYRIDLPSGLVTDLGPMPMPAHSNCENWAYWGVTEFVNGSVYLVYVRDSQAIVRTRVPDGLTTTLGTYTSLSDMCSFTLSLSRSRWYFHHEGSSQFGGSAETIGYANMNYDRAPTLVAVPDQTTPEDTLTPVIPLTVNDPETPLNNLMVRVSSSNTNLVPQANIVLGGSGGARTLQLLSATNQSGTATITITVTDSIGAVTSRSFTLTVAAVNDAPAFEPGPDLTVLEDAGPQTIPNWATGLRSGPADESGQSLTFEVNVDQPGLFAQFPGIDPNGTLTFTPAPQAYGNAVVSVTLRDNGGTASGGQDASVTRTFTISIRPVNDAPGFIGGPDVAVREDAGPQMLPGWASSIVAGPGNEASQGLTFAVTTDNAGLFAAAPVIAPDGSLSFTPAPGAYGSARVTVTLRDDGGSENNGASESAPYVFTIAVSSVNDAPSFVKGPDLTVDEDAAIQTLPAWATAIRSGPPNESGQQLQFILSNDNPSFFSTPPALTAHGTLTYGLAANANGSATVQVVLRDDGGTAGGGEDSSAPQTFRIVVRAINDAPVAQGQTLTVAEDGSLPITLTGSDADGDSITYVLISQPSHGTLTGTPPNLTYKPTANYFGTDEFQFKVRDASTDSAAATIRISVTAVNDGPVARATLRPTSNLFPDSDYLTVIAINGSNATVVLDGTGSSDPENDPLEYVWLDYGTIVIGTGALSTNQLTVGSHSITLLVDDGQDTGTTVLEVEVVSAAEAAEALALLVNQANFERQNKRPMIATLKASAASFERGNPISAINQLEAFQNKVRAQLGRTQPALADQLIRAAQELIDLWTAQGR